MLLRNGMFMYIYFCMFEKQQPKLDMVCMIFAFFLCVRTDEDNEYAILHFHIHLHSRTQMHR